MCVQELHERIRLTEYGGSWSEYIGNLKDVLLDNEATMFYSGNMPRHHSKSESKKKIFHMQTFLNLFMNAFNTLKW